MSQEEIKEALAKLKRGELSLEEKNALYEKALSLLEEKAGINSRRFFMNALLCREYMNQYGDIPLKGMTIYKGLDITQWLRTQRTRYLAGSLSEQRKKLLDVLNIPTNVKQLESLDSLVKNILSDETKEPEREKYLRLLADDSLSSLSYKDRAEAYSRFALLLGEKVGGNFVNFVKKAYICKRYLSENTLPPAQGVEYNDISLGSWYLTQKHAYLNGALSPGKKWILDKLEIPFERINKREKGPEIDYQGLPSGKRSEVWLSNLSLYITFKEEFDREPFRRELYKGTALGCWCQTQRKRYENRTMSSAEEEKLIAAGMSFEGRKRTPGFDEMLVLYREFKNTTKREPSIKEVVFDIKLGEWLAMQDFLYSRGELPVAEHRKLTEAGFIFSMDEKPVLNWKQMLYLYEKFKKETGMEPTTTEIYNCTQLGKWVMEQRQNVSELSTKQKEQLIAAGFMFDPKEEQWQDKFNLLKEFKERFDKFPVPQTIYKSVALGTWLWMTQKKAFYDGTMKEYRKDLLKEIGFSFDYAIDYYRNFWGNRFKDFVAFTEQHGRLPAFHKDLGEYKEEAAVGSWYQKQLIAREEGYLSKKQDKLLKAIEDKYQQTKEDFAYDTTGER